MHQQVSPLHIHPHVGRSRRLARHADKRQTQHCCARCVAHPPSQPPPEPAPPATPTRSLLEHHGHPIFCLKFNNCDPAYKDLLATVGSNKVGAWGDGMSSAPTWSGTVARRRVDVNASSATSTLEYIQHHQAVVYQCLPGGRVDVMQVYTDADVSPEGRLFKGAHPQQQQQQQRWRREQQGSRTDI
jgi:hypothetical protein